MASNHSLPGIEASKVTSFHSGHSRWKGNPYLKKKARLRNQLEQNFIDLEGCIQQIKALELALKQESAARTHTDTEELIRRKEGLTEIRDDYGTQRKRLHEECERLEQNQKEYMERKATELQELKLPKKNGEVARETSQAEHVDEESKGNDREATKEGEGKERK